MESNPVGFKALIALVWMSGAMVQDGVSALFRTPVWEVRLAAGRDAAANTAKDRQDILRLGEAGWKDGADGIWKPFFDLIRLRDVGGLSMVEWKFSEEAIDIMVARRRYALVDMKEAALLQTPGEIFIYLQMRVVWHRRLARLVVEMEDMRRVFSAPEMPAKRVLERVRRTAKRIESAFAMRMDVAFERDAMGDEIITIARREHRRP